MQGTAAMNKELGPKLMRAARGSGMATRRFEQRYSARSLHSGLLSEVRNGLIRIAVAYTGKFERNGKPFAVTENDLEDMARNLGVR